MDIFLKFDRLEENWSEIPKNKTILDNTVLSEYFNKKNQNKWNKSVNHFSSHPFFYFYYSMLKKKLFNGFDVYQL